MASTRVLLSAYTIRIHARRRKATEKLDLFDGEHDFLELCSKFLETQKEVQEHDKEAQHLMILHKLRKDNRAISGLFRSGEYGQACEVINAVAGEVVYTKKMTDADMLPFYFRIEVPNDSDEGFLIVQRGTSTGGGIKTSLAKKMAKWFEEKHEDYKLEFNPLMPAEVLKSTAKQGTIQSIRFIHFGLPKDIADRLASGHKEKSIMGTMEFAIKARRNFSLPLKQELMSFFSSKDKKIGDFYELKGVNFDIQEVKVDVKVGRQKRRIKLGEMTSSPLYDVTNEVEISKRDGNATFDSIDNAAQGLANGFKEGIYGDVVR